MQFKPDECKLYIGIVDYVLDCVGKIIMKVYSYIY